MRNSHRHPSYPSNPRMDNKPTAAKPTPMSTICADIQNQANRIGSYKISFDKPLCKVVGHTVLPVYQ